MKTHMLTMRQSSTSQSSTSQLYALSQSTTLSHQSTPIHIQFTSQPTATLQLIHLTMERHLTVLSHDMFNQCETTNKSSHTDQNQCALTPMQHQLCITFMTMTITAVIAAMTVTTISLLIFSMESEAAQISDSTDISIALHELESADHNAQKSNIMSTTRPFTSPGTKMLQTAMTTQRTPG